MTPNNCHSEAICIAEKSRIGHRRHVTETARRHTTGVRRMCVGSFASLRMTTLVIALLMGCQKSTPPPADYGQVPPFIMEAVTTESTFQTTRDAFKGSPWVANFIFTNCSGPCPLMSGKMAWLQKTLPSHVRFASFTIDPERDTPAVLQKYATSFQADPKRWWFLRGTPASVMHLAVEGFHLGIEKNPEAPSGLRFTHSTKFVLIDSSGVIRGFYDSTNRGLDSLLAQDIKRIR